jgi:hypothetical protein
LTSAPSSGSKTRVMLVLLKSAKSGPLKIYHNNMHLHTHFSYLQRVETEDH